jgi:hypothetical protein
MQCETCQKRKENQKLASRNYYIRNSEKIINKTLTRRYLNKKDERREQSVDGDEGTSSGSDEGSGSECGTSGTDEGTDERETETKK